jgi:hypothetical protein
MGVVVSEPTGMITGILPAIAVPLMFPRARRGTAYLGSMLGYLAIAAGLIVALVTA